MPRKKSIVHKHFKKAHNQGDRRVEVVECIHCGHNVAGNNVARLLKHLQHGCWPASSPEDPALVMRASSSSPSAARNGHTHSGNSELEQLNNETSVAIPTPGHPPRAVLNSRTPTRRILAVPDPLEPSIRSQCFLIQAIVKDTKDPAVSRLLSIPKAFTFRHLQRALSVALGYNAINGMFEITYPNWLPGKGRPPRRRQICIFHDEEQKNSWHAWDEPAQPDSSSDERYLDLVALDDLLSEVKSCKITFHVGPWAHDVEILGGLTQSTVSSTSGGHALCLGGEGHPVLESSDPLMWQAFKDAYAANPPNVTQKSYRAFYENDCTGGDPRGLAGAMPWKWDKNFVNKELRGLPAAPGVLYPVAEDSTRVGDELVDETNEDGDHQMTGNGSNEHNDSSNQQQGQRSNSSQNMFDQQNRGLSHQAQQPPYSLEQLHYA